MSEIVRLITRPANAYGLFVGFLDGERIVRSRNPLHGGARELLKRGFPAETLLTTRHDGASFDVFVPRPIGDLAQWTVTEEDRGGLRRKRYVPPGDGRAVVMPAPGATVEPFPVPECPKACPIKNRP